MKDFIRIVFLALVGIAVARNAVLPLLAAVDDVTQTLARSIGQ